MSFGTLYLCATPIGNLEDITLRAIRTLKEVDAIFCEDTRRAIKLLNHLGIKKPLTSCHEHNERERIHELLALLGGGKSVAYISDAGMPIISDPGEKLVGACIDAGYSVTVVPGACAVTSALALCGLSSARFAFEGFLSRDKKRTKELDALKRETRTIIIYESPNRLAKTLLQLHDVLGNRRAAVLRELTKLHEEARRAPLSELARHYENTPPKGECVIVVEGAEPGDNHEETAAPRAILRELLLAGLSAKDAVKAAERLGIPRNTAYELSLELRDSL